MAAVSGRSNVSGCSYGVKRGEKTVFRLFFYMLMVIFAIEIQNVNYGLVVALLALLDCGDCSYGEGAAKEQRQREDVGVDNGVCVHSFPGALSLLLFWTRYTSEKDGGQAYACAD
mgnify:CR=1 FL=1